MPVIRYRGGESDEQNLDAYLQFSKSSVNSGDMWVGVYTNCYCHQLSFLSYLAQYLKSQVPFDCIFGEPHVATIDGATDRFAGAAMVSLPIHFVWTQEAAVKMLNDAGWTCRN